MSDVTHPIEIGETGEVVYGPLNLRDKPGKSKDCVAIGCIEVGDKFVVKDIATFSEFLIFADIVTERHRPGVPRGGWIALREGKIEYAKKVNGEMI